ncbi:DUF3592 domain-containing protein [Thalassolituus sp. UBA2009]|jgi:hypothetical protein|uniref:DUF3592 domain-containing protein n=1 Tax=Thalassolituus sp. UBA2009 TaxID=1947658 RepID=UPI00257C936F|nr:DUF3592 domain-containing protein [Thalassolituus sp. UBA2009]
MSYKTPSYGLFKTNVTPLYWFGIPRNVKMDGLVMDVDHITHLLAHKNNDTQQWLNYNRASGARLSAMEHLVPEQMFSTEDSPANGISAVKALQLAAAEGQKIWTITRTNLDIALNGLQLPASVETDIRNSVYAGKEVTAHEKPVSFFGKSSVDYTVIDPETGAGAYLIGGGENGGDILTAVSGILGWLSGITSAGDNGKPIFYGGYKSLYKAAQAAKFLGIAALLAEAFLTLTDSSLSWSNKLGRLSGAMFAFASTTLVIGAAFAFAGPVFAAIIGVVFAIFMSVLLSAFYSRYLSQNTQQVSLLYKINCIMIYTLLFCILIAVSLISLCLIVIQIWTIFWKMVPIEITQAEVHEVQIQNRKRYKPSIRYTYLLDGKQYESVRWSLLGSRLFSDLNTAEKALNPLNAWVCPSAPSISFVYSEKRLLPSLIISLVISSAIIVIMANL